MIEDQVTYSMAMNVLTSWDALKSTPDYCDETAALVFERLHELEPRAMSIYEIPSHVDIKTIRKDANFKMYARNAFDTMDCTVSMLGPDLFYLSGVLHDMGRRHQRNGVDPSHLPYMSEAIFYALSKMLGPQFTDEDKEAWEGVMDYMISEMLIGMN